MRPTQNSITSVGQAAPVDIPVVGRTVSSSPVQFATDEGAFRSLEILKDQLATYNSGLMANAKMQDQLFRLQEQRKAELDFAKDPSKFDANSGSGYYYMHGMDLMGEAEAVKMATRAKTKVSELLANPDALRSTDVNKFIEDSIAQEMHGVNDPIVAKYLNQEAQKMRQSYVPALSQAQLEAENKYRRDTSHFVFSERADTPDNTRAYIQSDFQKMVSRLGKDAAVEVVTGVLANKINEAQTSEEAAGWLAMFGTQIPGTQGPNGKPLTFAQVGGEQLAGGVSKLRQSVQSMQAAEGKAAEQARKEAEREQARMLKEQQDMNYADAKALLDSVYDTQSAKDAVMAFRNMELSPSQRQSIKIQAATALGRMDRLEKAGLEDPDALSKKFATAVKTGDWQSGVSFMAQTLQRLRGSSDPSAVRGLVSTLFKDVHALQLETGADGTATMTAHNQALLGVYSSIQNDPDLVSFIPEKDQRFMRTLTNKMQEHGGNLASALRDTKAVMTRPVKPIQSVVVGSAIETLLDKTVSQKLMGDYDDVSPAAQLSIRQWANEAAKDMSELDYPTEDDLVKALNTKFNNEFLVSSRGFGPGRSTDVIFVGPKAAEGYAVKGEDGSTVQRKFNQTDIQMAWYQMRDYFEEQGYKDVQLRPYDHYTGDHVLSYSVNGTVVHKPLNVTQLNELGYKLAKESAAEIDLTEVIEPQMAPTDPVTGLIYTARVLPKLLKGKGAVNSGGVLERFANALELDLARKDVQTSVKAVSNTVAGQLVEQSKQAEYQYRAQQMDARLKK